MANPLGRRRKVMKWPQQKSTAWAMPQSSRSLSLRLMPPILHLSIPARTMFRPPWRRRASSGHFDSPSVFGAILDADKGGRFRIAPAAAGQLRQKQYYWPETNVLVTRFLHPDGIAEVEDYMPVGPDVGTDAQLVRRVRVVRGQLPLEAECRPAFDYARARHAATVSGHSARFDGPGLS